MTHIGSNHHKQPIISHNEHSAHAVCCKLQLDAHSTNNCFNKSSLIPLHSYLTTQHSLTDVQQHQPLSPADLPAPLRSLLSIHIATQSQWVFLSAMKLDNISKVAVLRSVLYIHIATNSEQNPVRKSHPVPKSVVPESSGSILVCAALKSLCPQQLNLPANLPVHHSITMQI